MAEKELAVCDECGSLFLKGSSQMMGLCPECAHVLYGYLVYSGVDFEVERRSIEKP